MIRSCLLWAALAAEPAPDAEAGVKAFAEGRYDDAARILERAYAAEPDPTLLFAWAQAERYAGRCDVAVPLYREYLKGEPPEDVRGLAREAITACGEDPDHATEPEPEPDVEPEPEPEIEPEPEVEPAPRRPAALDAWGHALTWSGVAVAGVGAGLLGEAHRRRGVAEDASHEQAYRDALEGAPVLSRAGIAVLAGGGALLVAGVVRFAVVAARGRNHGGAGTSAGAGAGGDATMRASRLRLGATGLTWKFELAPRRGRALR
jgi:tetratricopeptide (TPR) repeat protein